MVDLKVVSLEAEFVGDIPPDEILEEWKGALSDVLLIGFEKDTGELVIAGTKSHIKEILFRLELAKQEIFKED